MDDIVIFFEESKLSVLRGNNISCETIHIKGEVFYDFEDINDAVPFLADYLKKSLQLNDFDGFSIIVFYSSLPQIIEELCAKYFGDVQIISHSLDLVKIYQSNLNEWNDNILDAQKSELDILKKEQESLKEDYARSVKEIAGLRAEITRLTSEAELQKANAIKANLMVTKTVEPKRYFQPIDIPQNKIMKELVQNGAFVKKGEYIIATKEIANTSSGDFFAQAIRAMEIAASGNREYTNDIKAEHEGYLFWLTKENNGNGRSSFPYVLNGSNIVCAAFTSEKSDTLDYLAKFFNNGKEK